MALHSDTGLLVSSKMTQVDKKSVKDYFDRAIKNGKVTYWKPFEYRKKFYIMTFQYNLYDVTP